MSLLSAVLQEADKATTEDYKKHRDDLYPALKDLTERVELLSFALHQNFVDNYHNFVVTKTLEQLNYSNRKANIIKDHTNVSENINELNEKFSVADDEFDHWCEKLNKSLDNLNDLSVAVEGKRVLDEADHEFGRYNYDKAILSLIKLQNQLKMLKFEGDDSKALSNLLGQAENQLAIYSAQLTTEWEIIFSWSEKKSTTHLTYSLSVEQHDQLLIEKILNTLHKAERLNAELGLFSHFFINKLLHNVIRYNCDIFTEEHIGSIIFNIKMNLNDTNKPNYQTIFNNLAAVFEFLQTTLGVHLKEFMSTFSNNIRNKFFKKVTDDCIRNNLPSCAGSYENYKHLVLELDSLNKFLIEINFVESEKSPLNKFISDTECVLYNKKCDKLLFDVRLLLNESLSFGTFMVGTAETSKNQEAVLDVTDKDIVWDLNKPLFLPKCVISQNVKQIMNMIVEHLSESTNLPEKYSEQLVKYIKDIAVMYQTIVPQKFKKNLEGCPLDIALFFNNCFYLAHGLVGPPWKSSLPDALAFRLTTNLFESIQDLRVEGLEKMSLYLQNQRNIITNSIEVEDPNPWTYEAFDQFDGAVSSAICLMKDLKGSWYNILPTRMYELSMCMLIQTLCQSVLQRIMVDSRPVSEELVYMLAVRIEDMVEEFTSLFEEPLDFKKKINIWNRFSKMPQLLKGQLLEIAELWKKNKELSQSYTCEEVRQIIKMRFEDNKYRLKIFKEIQ